MPRLWRSARRSSSGAARLSVGQVHRLWQLLLKGYDEVRGAPDPLVAAQMALLRVLHAADLPDPGKLAEQLGQLAASGMAAPCRRRRRADGGAGRAGRLA
jgi:DNA polymerase-3 subunit gamma/tau